MAWSEGLVVGGGRWWCDGGSVSVVVVVSSGGSKGCDGGSVSVVVVVSSCGSKEFEVFREIDGSHRYPQLAGRSDGTSP